jgi:hypothetical protein
MDSVFGELRARMPLAEAVLLLWRQLAGEERLDTIFARYRGRCYEDVITFTTMVHLIADALLEHDGSANQSFTRAREAGALEATTRAAYGKLARIPIALSVGWFLELTDCLREFFPQAARRDPPQSLREFAVVTLDGKSIKRVAKRLKVLRSASGGVLGGKALVATEFSTGLALAMAADPNGDANDVRLVPDVLPAVRRRRSGLRLWVADRQFCDLVQMGRFSDEGDSFVLRYNAKVKFQRDRNVKAQKTVDDQGRRITDECGWLGRDGHPRQRYVRRITIHRNKEEDIAIVTDLMGVRKYPAVELLDMYLQRWGIEQMFQKVTEVFGLERLIGGTPEATVFQFAFCLLLYNQMQVVRAYVAKHQQREIETISIEQLFIDVRRELIAWTVVMPADTTKQSIPHCNIAQTRSRLDQLFAEQWTDRWIKSVNRKPRPQPTRQKTKTHTTAYRALQAARNT